MGEAKITRIKPANDPESATRLLQVMGLIRKRGRETSYATPAWEVVFFKAGKKVPGLDATLRGSVTGEDERRPKGWPRRGIMGCRGT